MPYPTYALTLHKTYYEKGFFNLGVEIERFVTPSDGEVSLMLGTQARSINARVNRKANLNGTPRIFGGKALSDWFQNNFDQLDTVKVVVLSPTELQLLPGSAP